MVQWPNTYGFVLEQIFLYLQYVVAFSINIVDRARMKIQILSCGVVPPSCYLKREKKNDYTVLTWKFSCKTLHSPQFCHPQKRIVSSFKVHICVNVQLLKIAASAWNCWLLHGIDGNSTGNVVLLSEVWTDTWLRSTLRCLHQYCRNLKFYSKV